MQVSRPQTAPTAAAVQGAKAATIMPAHSSDKSPNIQWIKAAAAADVADLEAAARKAHVAAQLLLEKEALALVGPAGGVWGSRAPGPALHQPLQLARVGMVERAEPSVSH